jgi:hypothetical protein
MTSTVGSQQRSVLGDLNGIADQADPDGVAAEWIADPVASACEAHRTMGVGLAEHLVTRGRSSRAGSCGAPVHVVVVAKQMAARVGGDDDAVAGDVQQPVL